jgi:hypothetical protein
LRLVILRPSIRCCQWPPRRRFPQFTPGSSNFHYRFSSQRHRFAVVCASHLISYFSDSVSRSGSRNLPGPERQKESKEEERPRLVFFTVSCFYYLFRGENYIRVLQLLYIFQLHINKSFDFTIHGLYN